MSTCPLPDSAAPIDNNDMATVARTVIARQLVRDSKGFLELSSFTLTDSSTEGDQSSIAYTGIARIIQDTAIWTENNTLTEGITLLTRFEPVPAIADLRGKIERSRVYQLWKKGTLIPFLGYTDLHRYAEGWKAVGYYRQAREEELHAAVTEKIKPSGGYLLFHRDHTTGALTSSHSEKSHTVIQPPAQAGLLDALARYMATDVPHPGFLKITGTKVLRRRDDPQGDAGNYAHSVLELEAVIELTRPGVSLDGRYVFPAPSVGDPAPDHIKAPAWKKSCYWKAGHAIRYKVSISSRKVRADLGWEQPTFGIEPMRAPLKSATTLLVRYQDTDEGTVIREATPLKKAQADK